MKLRRVVRLDFAPVTATADRARVEYHRDLIRPFGMRLDESALDGGPSYGEMGKALIERAVAEDEPVDVLVLAYAVPDLDPGRATATYLSHVCPGRPLAFAISDQGKASAFTALKLIGKYVRAGEARRAVLLVLEQPVLPYDPGVPVMMPAGYSGVALVFEPAKDSDGAEDVPNLVRALR